MRSVSAGLERCGSERSSWPHVPVPLSCASRKPLLPACADHGPHRSAAGGGTCRREEWRLRRHVLHHGLCHRDPAYRRGGGGQGREGHHRSQGRAVPAWGTEMDFKTDKWRPSSCSTNPNQTSACGCGESVAITPAKEDALSSEGGQRPLLPDPAHVQASLREPVWQMC